MTAHAITTVHLKTLSQPAQTLLDLARGLADYMHAPTEQPVNLETMGFEDRQQLGVILRAMVTIRKADLECASH